MTIPPKRPLVLACTLVIAAGSLAGCGSKSTATTTTTSTASSAPTVTAPPLPKPPVFAGKTVGAVADVKITDCGTDVGSQTAKVAVTNSTKAARDYSIMVIWLKNGSGTPLGSTMIVAKDAAPGKKTELSGTAKVVAKADKCVLNVLAGNIK